MSEALVQQTAGYLRSAAPDAEITRHGDLLKAALARGTFTISHVEMVMAGEAGIPELVDDKLWRHCAYISEGVT